MKQPEWIAYDVVLAIHEAQLAEHGGSNGIRDVGLLESALARPRNLFAYSEEATLYELAAAYGAGIAINRAFVDGNKRTAWVVCAVFLELNGIPVTIEQVPVVTMMLDLAGGGKSEQDFAQWLQEENASQFVKDASQPVSI